jgi:hypothetical protein
MTKEEITKLRDAALAVQEADKRKPGSIENQ